MGSNALPPRALGLCRPPGTASGRRLADLPSLTFLTDLVPARTSPRLVRILVVPKVQTENAMTAIRIARARTAKKPTRM